MHSILILSVLSIALVLAGNGCAAAAPPREVWNKTYGETGDEWAYLVIQTVDGGYFTAGRTIICSECPTDVWFVKTDPNVNEEWNGIFGKTGTDWVDHILQTPDGSYIVAGTARSRLHGVERSEFWVVRIDSNGDEQWNRTYGEGVIEWETFTNQTLDGGFIMGGTTYSFGVDHSDFWVMKTDPQGEEQWNWTLIGIHHKWIDSVHQATDGGFIAGGYKIGSMYALMKFDPDLWRYRI